MRKASSSMDGTTTMWGGTTSFAGATLRDYPLLGDTCRVVLRNERSYAALPPPIDLPTEIYEAAARPVSVPEPYDFALERKVLQMQQDRAADIQSSSADSRELVEQTILARMKSVTNADDDICIELLQANSYDLDTSIEAYFASQK